MVASSASRSPTTEPQRWLHNADRSFGPVYPSPRPTIAAKGRRDWDGREDVISQDQLTQIPIKRSIHISKESKQYKQSTYVDISAQHSRQGFSLVPTRLRSCRTFAFLVAIMSAAMNFGFIGGTAAATPVPPGQGCMPITGGPAVGQAPSAYAPAMWDGSFPKIAAHEPSQHLDVSWLGHGIPESRGTYGSAPAGAAAVGQAQLDEQSPADWSNSEAARALPDAEMPQWSDQPDEWGVVVRNKGTLLDPQVCVYVTAARQAMMEEWNRQDMARLPPAPVAAPPADASVAMVWTGSVPPPPPSVDLTTVHKVPPPPPPRSAGATEAINAPVRRATVEGDGATERAGFLEAARNTLMTRTTGSASAEVAASVG